MGFLDHIKRCNQNDPAHFHAFEVAGRTVGRTHVRIAAELAAFPDIFAMSGNRIILRDEHATPAARTSAMRKVTGALIEKGILRKNRNEDYPVVLRWGEEPAFALDRGAVPAFGTRAFGVHINGIVTTGGRQKLWIGRRAADKAIDPGKLDNTVAGGQPVGLSLAENVIKESAEEASIPAALASQARPVGIITYAMEEERGLRRDTLFLYDLELPADFTPVNSDGEITSFALMDIEEVAALARGPDAFKFNVNLVIIDFLIRHGYLSPDTEPDYMALANGLHGHL